MTEVIDVQYTAIIKDGGLFIPNVFSDLNDGQSYIVQVTVDIDDARQQLSGHGAAKKETFKQTAKEPKKTVKKVSKKEVLDVELETLRKSAVDELEGLNDSELSEIFKAYINDGQTPEQISLENL